MYTVRVTLDKERMRHIVIDKRLEALQESVHRARARNQSRITDVLASRPGPVKSPIQWTSDDQRNAFFASKGFRRGIPYERSGLMNEGWLSFSETIPGLGTRISIHNPTRYTQFVIGRFYKTEHIQQFHINTGHAPVYLKAGIIKKILIDGILEEFKLIEAT